MELLGFPINNSYMEQPQGARPDLEPRTHTDEVEANNSILGSMNRTGKENELASTVNQNVATQVRNLQERSVEVLLNYPGLKLKTRPQETLVSVVVFSKAPDCEFPVSDKLNYRRDTISHGSSRECNGRVQEYGPDRGH